MSSAVTFFKFKFKKGDLESSSGGLRDGDDGPHLYSFAPSPHPELLQSLTNNQYLRISTDLCPLFVARFVNQREEIDCNTHAQNGVSIARQ